MLKALEKDRRAATARRRRCCWTSSATSRASRSWRVGSALGRELRKLVRRHHAGGGLRLARLVLVLVAAGWLAVLTARAPATPSAAPHRGGHGARPSTRASPSCAHADPAANAGPDLTSARADGAIDAQLAGAARFDDPLVEAGVKRFQPGHDLPRPRSDAAERHLSARSSCSALLLEIATRRGRHAQLTLARLRYAQGATPTARPTSARPWTIRAVNPAGAPVTQPDGACMRRAARHRPLHAGRFRRLAGERDRCRGAVSRSAGAAARTTRVEPGELAGALKDWPACWESWIRRGGPGADGGGAGPPARPVRRTAPLRRRRAEHRGDAAPAAPPSTKTCPAVAQREHRRNRC